MRRRIFSFFAWSSTFFFLFITLLILHSSGRYDLWSWNTADSAEYPSSSASLGVGHSHFAFNLWIHPDDGHALCTTLDHIGLPREDNPLPDGRFVSRRAGLTIAHGALAAPDKVSYLGVLIPFWLPLVLFGLLPGYALVSAIRRRPPLRLFSRLMTAFSLASFALAVLVIVMWIRSFHYNHVAVPDKFFSENYAYFLSSRGITYWYFFDEPLHLQRPMWWRFPPSQKSIRLAATMDPGLLFLGFGRTRTTYFHNSPFSGRSPPRPLTIVAIPYYALLTAGFILPAIFLTQRLGFIIRARRRRKGQCPQCGYDLRATPELCPECGHTTASAEAAPTASAAPAKYAKASFPAPPGP